MEFNHLQDLLNTGFTIIEIGLFYGGEHVGEKNMQPDSWLFLSRSLKMAIFKTLNLLPKGHADKL